MIHKHVRLVRFIMKKLINFDFAVPGGGREPKTNNLNKMHDTRSLFYMHQII